LDQEANPKGKAMPTATRTDPGRIAQQAPAAAFPDTDALLSELGALYPVMAFPGPGDPPPADAREAPSGSSALQGTEERRTEMDERIMTGLVRA
jgi:hypothetical protein